MDNQKKLAIVILIGGKNIRFGYESAAVLNVLGKPLILHQIETLSKFDEDVFLVAHSEYQINSYYKKMNFPRDINFIVDDTELLGELEVRTPMLGVYSGFKELKRLGFEKGFLLSGDMPLIKPKVIEFMINSVKGYDCSIPRWHNGYLEPLFAIYPVKSTFELAKKSIQERNYAFNKVIDKSLHINYISVEESIKPLDLNLVSLINVNGPIDLEKVIKLYQ
ncbi:MAG TPA: molybdenum cofactor guanylyltransferase [Candidatus Nanopelagicaceae bacterium]|jgi:molybdopterin-guanine dinucleotide biosynthesis protein A|nr:molybdenum cofactor guanylyltransferase [Candidatus Nanopelagicaceae bacterium]